MSLECWVSNLLLPPTRLSWHHNGDGVAITPTSKPGISLESEKLAGMSLTRLVLASMAPTDSGTYTCSADDFPPAKVRVKVEEGKDISASRIRACTTCIPN